MCMICRSFTSQPLILFSGISKRLSATTSTSRRSDQRIGQETNLQRAYVMGRLAQNVSYAPQRSSQAQTSSVVQSYSSCPICFVELANSSAYQKHINIHHREAGLLPFTCKLCHRGFYTQSGLKYHEQTHGDQEFVCFVCSAKHKHKANLRRHLERAHHLRECFYCASYFKQDGEFERHILSCDRK